MALTSSVSLVKRAAAAVADAVRVEQHDEWEAGDRAATPPKPQRTDTHGIEKLHHSAERDPERNYHMIIWRGWGILAFIYVFAAFVATQLLIDALAPGRNMRFLFGFGILLAAAASWFTGIAINRNAPHRRLEVLTEARKAELAEYVEKGTFSRGPGHPIPQSRSEALVMADAQLEYERSEAQKRLVNQHSLLFIPLQYWGFVLGGIAVMSLISDVIKLNA